MQIKCTSFLSLTSSVLLMLLAIGARAADYYVDVNAGLDTNPGTQAQPYKTIQQGINAAAAGDTIVVAGGTYRESVVWSGKNLTLQGAGEGLSIIDPSSANGGPGGGCLYTQNLPPASQISGFTFQNGKPAILGGGIYNFFSEITVTHCTFTNNKARFGGGMSNYYGSATVSDCTFRNNTAVDGGGIYSDSTIMFVSNCTFSNHSVTANGGGVLIFSDDPTVTNSTIINCTFDNNMAGFGGGMEVDHATVTDCTFRNNFAQLGGGMVYTNSGVSAGGISNCIFLDNATPTNAAGFGTGGGLYNRSSDLVTNCTFRNNSATQGGGIYNYPSSSPTMTNCTFNNNFAADGGGMYTQSSNPTLLNCTCSNNQAAFNGGGMYNLNGSPVVTNCIFWGNQATFGSAGIGDSGGVTSIRYSDVQGLPNANPNAIGNFAADPLFVDVPGGDVRLTKGSPCRNRGDNTVVTSPPFLTVNGILIDLDGNPRLMDGTVDLGAYEVQNTAPVVFDDAYSIDEDTTLTIAAPGLLANDTDVEGDALTAVLVTPQSHGTLNLNPDGSFTYTPESNFSGTDSFTYKVSDGQAESTLATVTITIKAHQNPPDALDDAAATLDNTPVIISVLSNDSDPDGDALTVQSVTQADNGTVTLNTDGTVTYKPKNGFVGSDSFTYTINDGHGNTDTATVRVSVASKNHPPKAQGDNADTKPGVSVVIAVLSNDSDPDGDALSVQSVTQADNGTVTLNTDGTVTYKPNANFRGNDTFTYTVSDGKGGTDTARVRVRVR